MTSSEATQQAVMQQIAMRLRDTPYVLKGGAALMLTRNLDRHSTDLDFDSGKKLNLEGRIREGVEAADVEIISLKAVKDTDTVQRYKLHYLDPASGENTLLKIETSFRQAPQPETVEVVNNIKTYSVGYIFDQKMIATEKRTVARDLYDIAHLIKTQGAKLSPEQIAKADAFSSDIDELASLFSDSFEKDENLNKVTTVEDTVLTLREAVEKLQQNRPQGSTDQTITLKSWPAIASALGKPQQYQAWVKEQLGRELSKVGDRAFKKDAREFQQKLKQLGNWLSAAQKLQRPPEHLQQIGDSTQAFRQGKPLSANNRAMMDSDLNQLRYQQLVKSLPEGQQALPQLAQKAAALGYSAQQVMGILAFNPRIQDIQRRQGDRASQTALKQAAVEGVKKHQSQQPKTVQEKRSQRRGR